MVQISISRVAWARVAQEAPLLAGLSLPTTHGSGWKAGLVAGHQMMPATAVHVLVHRATVRVVTARRGRCRLATPAVGAVVGALVFFQSRRA